MTEELLHYIWQYQLFDFRTLFTQSGEPLHIRSVGLHNKNAGPDFVNARVRIGATDWAGNIEIHTKASEWTRHKHDENKVYDNVILHVVYESDADANRTNGETIPCLELKSRIDTSLMGRYDRLRKSQNWIPCEKLIKDRDSFLIDNWLERLLIERLEGRATMILNILEQHQNDWSVTFYELLTRNFGLKINTGPFEQLARSLPYIYLIKHRDNLFQVEALLFGQAGLLEHDYPDAYAQALKKEYLFLKHKFQLKAIDGSQWKFLRLRPPNFPTLRIAQLAALIHQSEQLFSQVLESGTVKKLYDLFKVQASEYWDTHYLFDSESPEKTKKLGKSTIDLLIINTIVPLIFVYGMKHNQSFYKQRAIDLLEQLKPEGNSIIKKFEELGIPADSAYRTQALLELKNHYCSAKKCLNCSIGNSIIQEKK